MLKVLTIPQIVKVLNYSKNNTIEKIVGTEGIILAADLRDHPERHIELFLNNKKGLIVNYQYQDENYSRMQEILRYGISRNLLVKCVGRVYRFAQQSVPYMIAESVSIGLNFNCIDTKPDFVNRLSLETRSKGCYPRLKIRYLDGNSIRIPYLFTSIGDELLFN